MIFSGRSRELGLLRATLDDRTPRVVRVTGLRGSGKTRLVQRALEDHGRLWVRVPPLPDPALRARFLARVRQAGHSRDDERGHDDERGRDDEGRATQPRHEAHASSGDDWTTVFAHILELAEPLSRPFVLCLDDAHRLGEARARYLGPMLAAQSQASAAGTTVHVVLIGPEAGLPSEEETRVSATGERALTIRLGPLPLRAAVPHLPGAGAADLVRAYGVFGGVPSVLALLDTSVTVGTNVRRLALDPDGPLATAGLDWIERDVQAPVRYVAIMATLAHGEADWATVHAGVPDLTRSGQVAPYLNRLVELGLLKTRRSLDAGPRSRSTRYAITDPFLAFWFRFVMPWMYGGHDESPGRHYATAIRPRLDDHLRLVFAEVCRQHLQYDAIETLGAVAREHGSVWGSDHDLPMAGILTSGAAYYGTSRWTSSESEESPLDQVERNMRETRYGFGRERRLRLVFTGRAATRQLHRDVARHPDAQLIDAGALVGV